MGLAEVPGPSCVRGQSVVLPIKKDDEMSAGHVEASGPLSVRGQVSLALVGPRYQGFGYVPAA